MRARITEALLHMSITVDAVEQVNMRRIAANMAFRAFDPRRPCALV